MECVEFNRPLIWTLQKQRKLARGQVRIRTRYAGINYAGTSRIGYHKLQIYLPVRGNIKRSRNHHSHQDLRYQAKLLSAVIAHGVALVIVCTVSFRRMELSLKNV